MKGGEKFWLKIEVHGGSGVSMSFRHWNYMGASFQDPHGTPGQRQMEMHHVH